jgi:hypothetical protein
VIAPDLLAAVGPLLDLLQEIGVRHYVGGSIASSAHGVARASIDADVVAELRPEHAERLCSALGGDYYVSEARVREGRLDKAAGGPADCSSPGEKKLLGTTGGYSGATLTQRFVRAAFSMASSTSWFRTPSSKSGLTRLPEASASRKSKTVCVKVCS